MKFQSQLQRAMPVYRKFLDAVAEQIGPEALKSLASEQRFCGKLRHWCAVEGGTGAGRQWRCASCSAGRRMALAKRRAQS